MNEDFITVRELAMQILKEPRKDIHDFHQNIASWIKPLVKCIKMQSIGCRNDTESKKAHQILECSVEWKDETTSTVWLSWPVNTPRCYEDHFDFLFEKPQVDTPVP